MFCPLRLPMLSIRERRENHRNPQRAARGNEASHALNDALSFRNPVGRLSRPDKLVLHIDREECRPLRIQFQCCSTLSRAEPFALGVATVCPDGWASSQTAFEANRENRCYELSRRHLPPPITTLCPAGLIPVTTRRTFIP